MNPKKAILLLDRNADALSVWAFMLATKGFRVLCASSPDEAVEILTESPQRSIHCLVCDRNLLSLDGDDLAHYAKMLRPEMTALLLGNPDGVIYADACLPRWKSSPAELVERIQILTRRKRGPKAARGRELTSPVWLRATEVA